MLGFKKKNNENNKKEIIVLSILMLVLGLYAAGYFGREMLQKEVSRMMYSEIEKHAIEEEAKRVKRNEDKCESSFVRMQKRWNNIQSVYYKEEDDVCMVKYDVDGEVEEAQVGDMRDIE